MDLVLKSTEAVEALALVDVGLLGLDIAKLSKHATHAAAKVLNLVAEGLQRIGAVRSLVFNFSLQVPNLVGEKTHGCVMVLFGRRIRWIWSSADFSVSGVCWSCGTNKHNEDVQNRNTHIEEECVQTLRNKGEGQPSSLPPSGHYVPGVCFRSKRGERLAPIYKRRLSLLAYDNPTLAASSK